MLSKESEKGALVLSNETTDSETSRQIYLTQEINLTTFAVIVSRFQPGSDDTTAYVWTDAAEIKKEYEIPPYYICDMAEAGENMRRYARIARPEIIRVILANANPMVRKTFEETERFYAISKVDNLPKPPLEPYLTRILEQIDRRCTNVLVNDTYDRKILAHLWGRHTWIASDGAQSRLLSPQSILQCSFSYPNHGYSTRLIYDQ